VVTQFKAYRASEGAEGTAYAALGDKASHTTIETISDTEIAIAAAAREASAKPNDLTLTIMRLAAQVRMVDGNYRTALEPYAALFTTEAMNVPDMTAGCLSSLEAMLAYIQARTTRSDATANALLEGIAVRRQALIVLGTDQATRDTLAQAELLKASTALNDEATARIDALWKTPPMSVKLKLPYLADRYDQFTTFLQLQPLCDASSSAWRETGCVALRRHFNTSQSYLANTIPTLIKMGINMMRAKGVDGSLLDAALAKLATGEVKAAATLYDAAVRSSEGT